MITALVSAAVVLAAASVALYLRSADRLVRSHAKRTVVVEMRDGATFKGLMAAADARSLLLRNTVALGGPQTATTPVDGELLIPRADVRFVQRP